MEGVGGRGGGEMLRSSVYLRLRFFLWGEMLLVLFGRHGRLLALLVRPPLALRARRPPPSPLARLRPGGGRPMALPRCHGPGLRDPRARALSAKMA